MTRGRWPTSIAIPRSPGTAARDDAFARLGLAELISIIHPSNARSQRLAQRLGMSIERYVYNPVLDRQVEVWHTTQPRL